MVYISVEVRARPSFPYLTLLAIAAAPAGCDASAIATPDAASAPMDSEAPVEPAPDEPQVWLRDVTVQAGIDFSVPDEFVDLPDRMGGGVCVLDADGADPLDLVFALRDGVRLFVASEPLAFADQTEARGLGGIPSAMGCLAFDADGDGDDDLLVTDVGAIRLFLSEAGRFEERTEDLQLRLDPQSVYTSAAAGDVDGDGDVDLLVAGMIAYEPERVAPGCEPCRGKIELYDPIANLLLLREGDRYRSDTALAPELALEEMTLVVSITDLDGDGAIDIYVGNDLGGRFFDRALVRGADGVYRDAYLTVGLGHDASGYGIDTMGFSSADVDDDGRIDHVATGFEGDPTVLFLCRHDGFCEPQPGRRSGTDELAQSFRWGAALVDLDVDGLPDLVEATGHISSDAELEGRGARDQPPNLMRNVGGRFRAVEVVPEDGRASRHSTRGIAVTDLDEDGLPDIVLAPAVGRPVLLRNAREPKLRPLVVEVVGASPNTGAIGARVAIHAGSARRVQDRRVGEGYLGSFSPRLFFAVPDRPATIEVRWPDGEITTLEGVEPGGVVSIRR